jgi:hypothetical protein
MRDVCSHWTRTLTALLLVLLATLIISTVGHSQDEAPAPLSPEEYAAAARAAESLLRADPAALDTARRQLAAVEQVVLHSGEIVTVAPVLGDDRDDLDSVAAQKRLQAVTRQFDTADTDQTIPRLAVLENVLAGPAFQNRESWLEQLRRWLANFFQQWAGNSEASVAPTPVSATLAQVVGWGVGRCRQRAPDCAAGALVADAAARLCR